MKTIQSPLPVLVPDDDDFILDAIRHTLRLAALTDVHAVKNAAAALDILRETKGEIELIVLGLNMPRPGQDRNRGRAGFSDQNGQCEISFPARIDVRMRMPVGVEMLAPWTSPGNNNPPGIFIPITEESQLIDPLTIGLFSRALVWARKWQQAGINLHLAINVSMRSLYNIDFSGRFLAMISDDLAAPGPGAAVA